MASPAHSPTASAHHVPEAVWALLAVLAVLAADAAVLGLWWWGEQGTGSAARTWLVGIAVAVAVASVAVLLVRHPVTRRAAVGALAVAVVLDAVVVGYHLSGTTLLGAL